MRNSIVNVFARLRQDEKGVTLVEYGIALVLAITVGTTALIALGAAVSAEMGEGAALMTAS